MGSSRRTVIGLLVCCMLVSGCGGTLRGVPTGPSTRLATREFIVWHSLKRLLFREDVRGPGIAAICVGLGTDGGGAPSDALLGDFSEVEPPVVSAVKCARRSGSGWELREASGAPATFLAFFDVDESPYAMTVQARIEVPGRAPEVRTCAVEVLGVPVRRSLGGAPSPAGSGRRPPPPRVSGC